MKRAAPGRPRRRRRRALAALLAVLAVCAVLWQRCGLRGCPNVDRLASYMPGGATVLLDDSGKPFADLSPIAHTVVPLDSLPAHVPSAFVAVEDKRFYGHNGIDYRRVGGALLADVRARAFVQGFSTITMQLARNVWPDRLPGQNRTIRRKLLEIRVARDIERHYSKREILELYLNHIYFGGGAYGIDAASRNYFGKPASRLTLAESALLAALPRSPTLYNPRRFGERARARRDLVLRLMAEQGLAPPDSVNAARDGALAIRAEPVRPRAAEDVAPWFIEAARRTLEARFGEDVYTSPLRVHTTLNVRAQREAEQQLERQLRAIESGTYGTLDAPRHRSDTVPHGAPEYLQGALVLMDAQSGDVRALVGGRDYAHSRLDRASQARRHAGSAFFPFVLAAALADGYAPSQQVADSTLDVELPDGTKWRPRAVGGGGVLTLRDALVQSKPLPLVRIAAETGLGDIARLARRAGVRSGLTALPDAATGSAAVTPLELAAAYSAFARSGAAVRPRFVTRVVNAAGEVIWDPAVSEREVVDSAAAYLVNDMLREAVDSGVATSVRRAGYRGIAAGTAGSTEDGADVWFAGYTPRHVGTVWIGFDRPRPVVSDSAAIRLAAPVWARTMRTLHPDDGEWVRPSTVVEHRVDPATGAILGGGCNPREGRAARELFVRGDEPASVCPAGAMEEAEASVITRTGGWMSRRWKRIGHWMTRHFGSEERQRAPREKDYLGRPRLPRAVEVPQ